MSGRRCAPGHLRLRLPALCLCLDAPPDRPAHRWRAAGGAARASAARAHPYERPWLRRWPPAAARASAPEPADASLRSRARARGRLRGDPKLAHEARELGHRLFRLFRELLGRETRAVPELHHWTPLDTGTAFEPGHHFEWIWLLDRYAARSGVEVDDLVEVLAERAYAAGIDRDGAAIEAVGSEAHLNCDSRRCWASCEALKAAASRFASGRCLPDVAIAQATRSLKALRSLFLAGLFPGGWIDRVDASGKPLLDHVPASTLYHLFLALAEADRAFGHALPSPLRGRR